MSYKGYPDKQKRKEYLVKYMREYRLQKKKSEGSPNELSNWFLQNVSRRGLKK
jgi:hypothetical protein